MKKILIIGQTPPPYGGQIIHIGKIVSIFEKNKIEFQLIRMFFSEDMNENGKFSFKKIWKLLFLQIQTLYKLASYRPDYVYYPLSGCEKIPVYRDIVMLFFVRLFGFKTIFHFHAGGIAEIYPRLNFFMQKLFKFIFFKSGHSICMSKSGLKDPQFLESKNIEIIPYGVERSENEIKPDKYDMNKKCQVLFVGVCRESKGILDFIKVIDIANKADSRIIGKIVGKIFSEKEQEAVRRGIEQGIIISEGVKIGDEKNTIFKESDLFLFPSFFEHENFPTVVLEAFSYGIPVISTKWRGIVDQIEHGRNGYLHELHDIRGMADSIIKIANNKVLYKELSTNAFNDYNKLYTNRLFEKNIIKFFNNLA